MITSDVIKDDTVKIHQPLLVNIYGCKIGSHTRIGAFVEIQKGVVIGENCKISSHTFICTGVHISDEVFIGHGVMFTNDKYPRATDFDGKLKGSEDYELLETFVGKRASIGSGAVILPGVKIGDNAIIGAGAVVIRDVPDNGRYISQIQAEFFGPSPMRKVYEAHSLVKDLADGLTKNALKY